MIDDPNIIHTIINVNHAGGYGAIRLYNGQLLMARLLYPGMSWETLHCLAMKPGFTERFIVFAR